MADKDHIITLQFKHKVHGDSQRVEVARQWIERMTRVTLHDHDLVMEIVKDEVVDETLPLFPEL